MFERYHTPAGKDEMFRKMLFGGNERKNIGRMPAVPAMEQVSPQAIERRLGEDTAESPCLEACSLAMVYSPMQQWQGIYPVEQAIGKGTLFAELDKPFLGKTLGK